MKVISAKEMARIEHIAYQEGASEVEFMRQAGYNIALAVQDYVTKHHLPKKVMLLCGKGNNGGDAYVAGSHLLISGYEVEALQLAPLAECSPLCRENAEIFRDEGGILKIYNPTHECASSKEGVILDGIFGTGFHGALKEPYASVVKKANSSGLPILAIDIPSGVNGDTGQVEGEAVKATLTLFLELPKTGFFLQDAWNYVGKLQYVTFGLPSKYILQAQPDFSMITQEMVQKLLPPIVRNRHKYQRGYVIGVSGSPGMPGAALLSSLSSLRGGAGIMRLMYPQEMEHELVSSAYEVIKESYDYNKPDALLEIMSKGSALYIGPGMGRSTETKNLLKNIIPRITKPSVIDGDALTIIAEENIALPSNAVLTPHKGELLRLLKIENSPPLDKAFLELCQNYAEKNNVTLLLKGAPTFIFHPGEKPLVCPRGDPGMATAGSGDVLTGLIAALLAQGLGCHQAAILGVYLHAVAGEYAAIEKTSYAMIASDIIAHFSDAIKELSRSQ